MYVEHPFLSLSGIGAYNGENSPSLSLALIIVCHDYISLAPPLTTIPGIGMKRFVGVIKKRVAT